MKRRLFIQITDSKNNEEVHLCIYQRPIRKLIYFSYGIMPDITFVIEELDRQKTNSRKKHFQVTKKIVRDLKIIIEICLTFG